MYTKLFAFLIVFGLAFGLSVAQEPAGSLVFRNDEGTETGVQSVVSSAQYQAMLDRQAAMNDLLTSIEGKVDYLVTAHAVAEEENPLTIAINTATYQQILEIPGIGPVKAGTLISARDTPTFQPFTSWSDLQNRVVGIGPSTLADIQASGVQLDAPTEEPEP